VIERMRGAARAAAWPAAGLAVTYVAAVLTPLGRRLDQVSVHGRFGASWGARAADLWLLETISVTSLVLALAAVVLVGGLNGRWRLGLRAALATFGAVISAEVLKYLLPGTNLWTGEWSWMTGGTFPSGHTAVAASVSLAILSVCSGLGRRLLVGPLVAGTAITATATVTVGWHRPSDVLAGLFLAAAWHRALSAGLPAEQRLRSMLPVRRDRGPAQEPAPAGPRRPGRVVGAVGVMTGLWWAGACVLVLGVGMNGLLRSVRFGELAPLAYAGSLAVLLAGALGTIVLSTPPDPVAAEPPRNSP
jgi:membrane-associated phospholipid phosphatase